MYRSVVFERMLRPCVRPDGEIDLGMFLQHLLPSKPMS
jgi:hypothetical protein